ncbi:NAD-binding protein [Gloeopeniophorella convolvens]|nr:NAD-binding protein [Gloeopeniophorella convolvens]
MSGYKNFAIIGAGALGSYVIRQFLKEKAAGTVNQVVVLTRQLSRGSHLLQGSNTAVDGDAKVVAVDYSNKESIKSAFAGIDVAISTIAGVALGLQASIAEAAKEAGVKLFVPSEFGGVTEGATEGLFTAKANIQTQLKAIGIPYTLFYTGPFSDFVFNSHLWLDLSSGKVTIGGDGNTKISFTSRTDIARYLAFVLTCLPAEQLHNRAFSIAGDTKSFNEVFQQYEAKTGKKLDVTYTPVSELDAKIAANPHDFASFLHKVFATAGPFQAPDNNLYPEWNPSSVIDNIVA